MNKNTLLIRGAQVLFPDGKLKPAQVLVEQGIITAISEAISRAVPTLDMDGAYVLPGLIDIHLHGIGYDSSATSLADFAAQEARCGTTAFCPTFFGVPEETADLLLRHRKETDELRALPQVIGFRVESPYLFRAGGGVTEDIAPITEKTTNLLLEAAGSHVKIWDISPELEGAPGLVSRLSKAGVTCSLAHTNGTIEQARAAVDAGARLATHFFNVFPVPVDAAPGIYPVGMVDYLLLEDRLTCEIIPDGTHVPPLLVEKAFRCKPADKVVFITDSNNGAGMPPGEYTFNRRGRLRIDGPNNGVRMVDRNNGLAGSALTPIDAFRNAVRIFGLDLAGASRVCSANPAELLGLNKGVLAPGRDGDLVIMDRDLQIICTVVAGKVIYRR